MVVEKKSVALRSVVVVVVEEKARSVAYIYLFMEVHVMIIENSRMHI